MTIAGQGRTANSHQEPPASTQPRLTPGTAALHTDFDPTAASRVVRKRLLEFLVSMRYGLAATVLQGVEDFLDGPECLHDGGIVALASVHKLRAEYPETQTHPASDVPGVRSTAMPLVTAPPAPDLAQISAHHPAVDAIEPGVIPDAAR